MSDIRGKLIDIFYDETEDRMRNVFTHYDNLIASLILKRNDDGEPVSDINNISIWFKNIARSISLYKVNTTRLILVGPQGIGKTIFFKNIFPEDISNLYTDFGFKMKDLQSVIYSKLIFCDDDFSFSENAKKILSDQNYIIHKEDKFITDKRLVSYCATMNILPRATKCPKSNFIIELDGIDKDLYNSIDKLELWKDIFFKFCH